MGKKRAVSLKWLKLGQTPQGSHNGAALGTPHLRWSLRGESMHTACAGEWEEHQQGLLCHHKRSWRHSKTSLAEEGMASLTSVSFNYNCSAHTCRKPKPEPVSQHLTHANLKDVLTWFFTGQLQYTRASPDRFQPPSHRIVLRELLVRNILYYFLELPCVVE